MVKFEGMKYQVLILRAMVGLSGACNDIVGYGLECRGMAYSMGFTYCNIIYIM